MFIDSDFNNPLVDSDKWSNHPGLFGWTWSPRKREEERVENTLGDLRGQCNVKSTSSKNCAQLDDAYWCLDDKNQDWLNADTGSRGARRVRTRHLNAISELMDEVEGYQDSRDCQGATSGLDTALDDVSKLESEVATVTSEAQLREAGIIGQAEQALLAKDKQRKTIMIVGGAVIAVLLLALVMKK